MTIDVYENIECKRPKSIGKLSLLNKYILSFTEKGYSIADSIGQTFHYRAKKNNTAYLNNKINAEIILEDGKTYFVHLSKYSRRALYRMFKGHWLHDNVVNRFLIKHKRKLPIIQLTAIFGFQAYKLIKASIALIVMLKACG